MKVQTMIDAYRETLPAGIYCFIGVWEDGKLVEIRESFGKYSGEEFDNYGPSFVYWPECPESGVPTTEYPLYTDLNRVPDCFLEAMGKYLLLKKRTLDVVEEQVSKAGCV